jgi:pullulanase
MGCAKLVRKQMQFLPVKGNNLLAFILKGFTNGDTWKNIIVAFNSRKEAAKLTIPEGEYVIVCQSGDIDMKGLGKIVGSEVLVQPQSALIMHQ